MEIVLCEHLPNGFELRTSDIGTSSASLGLSLDSPDRVAKRLRAEYNFQKSVRTFLSNDIVFSEKSIIFAAALLGMWRSWLAHHVRDVGVVRSSRIIPTNTQAGGISAGFFRTTTTSG